MTKYFSILKTSISKISFKESLDKTMQWALEKKSSYICFANIHMIITAYRDNNFCNNVNNASLVLADGKPISICSKIFYKTFQERIAGMDFLPNLLQQANKFKLSVFIYGSTVEVLRETENKIRIEFPDIHFAGSISPPFYPMTVERKEADIDIINKSGAHIVLVSLGCPKQEIWMAENTANIKSVLLGIGGALPVFAGLYKRAPVWMQKNSLEWLYRLFQQPGRLLKRYLFTNSLFIYLIIKFWFKKNFSN